MADKERLLTSRVEVRLPAELRARTESVLDESGLTLSTGIRLLLQALVAGDVKLKMEGEVHHV